MSDLYKEGNVYDMFIYQLLKESGLTEQELRELFAKYEQEEQKLHIKYEGEDDDK